MHVREQVEGDACSATVELSTTVMLLSPAFSAQHTLRSRQPSFIQHGDTRSVAAGSTVGPFGQQRPPIGEVWGRPAESGRTRRNTFMLSTGSALGSSFALRGTSLTASSISISSKSAELSRTSDDMAPSCSCVSASAFSQAERVVRCWHPRPDASACASRKVRGTSSDLQASPGNAHDQQGSQTSQI